MTDLRGYLFQALCFLLNTKESLLDSLNKSKTCIMVATKVSGELLL